MTDQYIGEIRMFSGTVAPRGWAFCNGQLLSIPQNPYLFSILGNLYGGDGRSTFALPDMRGRAPLHHGSGPGLDARELGESGGEQSVALTVAEMPSHKPSMHLVASSLASGSADPSGKVLARSTRGYAYGARHCLVDMDSRAVSVTTAGAGAAHENMQPFLAISFIIALEGEPPEERKGG